MSARHVDPEDHSFRRSLLRAAAGGLAALVVTFAVTLALTRMGTGAGEDSPAMMPTDDLPTVVALPESLTPSPPSASPSPSPSPSPRPTPAEVTEAPQRTATVQVLDAVGSGTFAEDAAAVLEELGYRVVVVNDTPRRVEQTTVLATPGREQDAEELRDADSRFANVDVNTAFSTEVDLHVLVGPDFRS